MNESTTPVNERNEWRTPEALVNYCASLVGGLDYDTACTLDNAVAKPVWYDRSMAQPFGYAPIKEQGGIWVEDAVDALNIEWKGKCFCNPPYDNIKPWVEKALRSTGAITVMVLPSPNGETVYRELLQAPLEIHIIGRVSFIGSNGKPRNGNPRGTSIFIVKDTIYRAQRALIDRSYLSEFGRMNCPAPVWTPPCS